MKLPISINGEKDETLMITNLVLMEGQYILLLDFHGNIYNLGFAA